MPEISRFYGIVIGMFYNDHNPPHFHAIYGRFEAKISIDPPGLLAGEFPPRALAMVIEWAAQHRLQLLENWRCRTANQPLNKVEPLR